MLNKIPQPVRDILQSLQEAGFEAYIVGGCVRDILLNREPKDWDVTTNARPDKIQEIFPDSFYENEFGTVGVKVPISPLHPVTPLSSPSPSQEYAIIEVTTYRTESSYSDNRRPDSVHFTTHIEEDLKRRDFTMNSIAVGIKKDSGNTIDIRDPFNGQDDIQKKVIRAVGDPDERFREDALRLMRAVRFYAELRTPTKLTAKEPVFDTALSPSPSINANQKILPHIPPTDWHIESSTFEALKKNAALLQHISWERIRDEFSRIMLSPNAAEGVDILRRTGLLRYILPELETGVGVEQNLHHIYTVYEHNLRALKTCGSDKLDVRLAALLHDVGKPRTKHGTGYRATFYNHDHVGARMTRAILTRLRYPTAIIEKVSLLVDNHLFYYNVGEVTEASVRRLIKRVSLENIPDLIAVRIGDRLGSGTPKAKPYRLRHFEYMVDKVSHDPVSVKTLAINGTLLMQELSITPGPKIGALLDVLLAEVIEDPTLNTQEYLLNRARKLQDEPLATLREKAKDTIEEERTKDDQQIKKRHWVA